MTSMTTVHDAQPAQPAAGGSAGAAGRRRHRRPVRPKFFGTSLHGPRAASHRVTILGVAIAFILLGADAAATCLDGARFNGAVYDWMALGRT